MYPTEGAYSVTAPARAKWQELQFNEGTSLLWLNIEMNMDPPS